MLVKLVVIKLVAKFSSFYGTWNFTAAFTKGFCVEVNGHNSPAAPDVTKDRLNMVPPPTRGEPG
jgi:hypothetical protein